MMFYGKEFNLRLKACVDNGLRRLAAALKAALEYRGEAKLLTEQARAIERLNVILGNHGVTQLEKTEIMLVQKERIRELEAERDKLQWCIRRHLETMDNLSADLSTEFEDHDKTHARIRALEAERDALQKRIDLETDCYAHDAIRAKAIEECDQAIRDCPSLDENGYICTKDAALKAIRALNQQKPQAETE